MMDPGSRPGVHKRIIIDVPNSTKKSAVCVQVQENVQQHSMTYVRKCKSNGPQRSMMCVCVQVQENLQ